ncbi:SDR family NAD(P)-dependent oxidoreductase, partial [Rathayibacter sp. AY1D5]|uniref:SDR family NAD(P)-dependent oxidoreductase n=1 Tax=Rathayibacter sp. AY1D5 TaxID=2080546 RepID=UPI0021583E4D
MTTTLITGANRSLGLETARRLLEAGHTVYAGMRDTADGDAARALGAHPVRLDVTDQASVDSAIASGVRSSTPNEVPSTPALLTSTSSPGREAM